jgi:hypothetical protein
MTGPIDSESDRTVSVAGGRIAGRRKGGRRRMPALLMDGTLDRTPALGVRINRLRVGARLRVRPGKPGIVRAHESEAPSPEVTTIFAADRSVRREIQNTLAADRDAGFARAARVVIAEHAARASRTIRVLQADRGNGHRSGRQVVAQLQEPPLGGHPRPRYPRTSPAWNLIRRYAPSSAR